MKNNQTIKKCALCTNLLTKENLTKEHIIPNSIGGRKKTKGFICNTCNNDYGKKWEAVLAEQFLWFSLATGIKRERGTPPNLQIKTTAGEELLLRHDGTMTPANPTYIEQKEENGKIKIQLQVRTKEEANHIIKGVIKKYPSLDAKAVMENFVVNQRYLDIPVKMNFEFGGQNGGRSMVKTALALASEYGINHNECVKAINYLKNEDVFPPFGFCYIVDIVENRPQEEIFHCVAVRGLREHGKLLAYVEYFNMARILIELNDKYNGEDFYHSYAIDPTTGTEIHIDVNFNIDKEVLQKIINDDEMPLDKYTEAANYVLPIVLKKNFHRERNRVFTDAAKFAFEKLGVKPDDSLPPEKYQKFSALIVERIMPFLTAHMKNRIN
jgi:hypothetical protein